MSNFANSSPLSYWTRDRYMQDSGSRFWGLPSKDFFHVLYVPEWWNSFRFYFNDVTTGNPLRSNKSRTGKGTNCFFDGRMKLLLDMCDVLSYTKSPVPFTVCKCAPTCVICTACCICTPDKKPRHA